jgi:hypothetical protein
MMKLKKKKGKKLSLKEAYPSLAEEWHPEKNGELTPEKVSPVNARRVWWRCKNGHEWQTTTYNRVHGKKGATCPHCDI